MSEPHPLRCETCDYYKPVDTRYTGDCAFLDHWLTTGEYLFTSIVGCASHSAAPKQGDAEQRIRDVIGELEKRRNELKGMSYDHGISGWILGLEEAIALLRGKE